MINTVARCDGLGCEEEQYFTGARVWEEVRDWLRNEGWQTGLRDDGKMYCPTCVIVREIILETGGNPDA